MTPIRFIDLLAQRERIADKIDRAVLQVLASGQYIMGPAIAEAERELARFCGARHALTCANGTDALRLVLMAWGVGPGDAVFVPSFTFAATAEVVALVGATPVFVDVEAASFNMDPDHLERTIAAVQAAGTLRPRAVIPVDLFGQPADYDRLAPVAAAAGLKLLADTAQGFGASYRGRRTGAIGDAAATSFFPAKPLGVYGDGGAIFVPDDETRAVLESLRVHGQGSDRYDNVRIGLNGRFDTIQAAILLEKLAIYEDEIARRNAVAGRYNDGLRDLVTVPEVAPGCTSIWAQYTVLTGRRPQVLARLAEAGVPTAVYYPKPLHRQTAYRAFPVGPGGLPVSDALAEQVFSLPMHPYLDAKTQDFIIAAVRRAAA